MKKFSNKIFLITILFSGLPDCLKKLKEALGDLAQEKGIENITSFVDVCTRQVAEVLRADEGSLLSQDILTTPINPTPILRREVQLWLTGIKRRIGGRRSIRNPYYGEVNRDISFEIFNVICRIVRGLHGFVEPFCFHKENKKAIIISFTTMRLVNELFALLSGLSKDVVAGYFKRTFSGSRKGHTAAVIVSEVKDFALTYKKRSGKLVI